MVSVTQPVDTMRNLSAPEQLFCALVASGWNYRQAAEKAGWEKRYGWDKMQNPIIRDYVKELSLAAPDEALRLELSAELTMIRRRLAEGEVDSEERATIELRLKAVMAQAKFAGLIVDRKSVERSSVDLSLVSVSDLRSHLGKALELLEPGAKRAIEDRVAAAVKRSKSSKVIENAELTQ